MVGLVGFDPVYGARPLKRPSNGSWKPIAKAILAGRYSEAGISVELESDR